MLKNLNPVTIAVPQATRDVFNQIAQASGKQQHQVVAEAAELLRRRQERQQKGGQQK
jgi:hypothetical protein